MIRGRRLRFYIARRFAVGMIGAFVVCMALIFMIDLIELLRQAKSAATISIGTVILMTALRLPAYSEILLPFAVLVGSIGALLSLSRKSELAVMRAGGMSVWQFLRPGITTALVIGVVSVVAYNPLAAAARAQSERMMAELLGTESALLQNVGASAWLRQDGPDGASVLNAKAASNQGLTLVGVTAFHYDTAGHFVERIEAQRADLGDGVWTFRRALVARPGQEAKAVELYTLTTYLTQARAQDALGSEIAVSFWQLPGLIEVAEKAKLSADRYRIQYELLLSRPLLLVAMVLLAATVSLRSFRMGGIQSMVVTGIIGGVGFFLLTEVSRQIGLAGLVAPSIAVWTPVLISILVSFTVLLHQEDG